MKKLHYILVQAVITGLKSIFEEGYYADKVVERVLKSNAKWGSRDRAFIATTIYDIVRWKRLLTYYAQTSDDLVDENEIWSVFVVYWLWKGNQIPDWQEFKNVDLDVLRDKMQDELPKAIAYSVPDWMYNRLSTELGEERAVAELEAMNHEAYVWLRANSLKTTSKELQKSLLKYQVETILDHRFPDALRLTERKNVFSIPLFQEGNYEVQDAGSQCIARLLDPQPGMRVIDACAGAGGKTLHIAALMQNKGRIIAMDTEAWKLEELKRRTRRAGVGIVETKPITTTKVIKRLENSADRLLLDVPCSGMGVLRRNPDAKWKLKEEFIQRIQNTQQEIIQSYSRMLKSGGLMVYATCSILPSENERQVATFLANNNQYRLVEEKSMSSANDQTDGFYMALIEKG